MGGVRSKLPWNETNASPVHASGKEADGLLCSVGQKNFTSGSGTECACVPGHQPSSSRARFTADHAHLETQPRRDVGAHVLTERIAPLRLEHQAELLACVETRELRVAHGVRAGIPHGRTVWKAVETPARRGGAEVDELELVGGVVVHEGRGEARHVVDARAVVDDPEPRGRGCERVEREGRGVADAESEERAAEEVLSGRRG